jgi:hypothetical protein
VGGLGVGRRATSLWAAGRRVPLPHFGQRVSSATRVNVDMGNVLKISSKRSRNRTSKGTPQGGVISPLLANIFLHEVLDEWWVRDVQPRLGRGGHLFRYADDFVAVFLDEADARRVLEVLPKRFGKYGLTIHPEKTRLVAFQAPRKGGSGDAPGSFDLLGFTHRWQRSRKGFWVVRKVTSPPRFRRGLLKLSKWLVAAR